MSELVRSMCVVAFASTVSVLGFGACTVDDGASAGQIKPQVMPPTAASGAAAPSSTAPNPSPSSRTGTSLTRPQAPTAGAGASPSTQPGTPPSAAPATPAAAAAAPASAPPTMMLDPTTPLDQIPAECRGFDVRGLKTSPGGSTLPNKCAPFDGERNNPYAIRCIDADPNYHTQFAGDGYCILPPPGELGTQVHVGPADYGSPGQFTLAGGDETTAFFNANAPNTAAQHYYRANWRMRPGGHHMLISLPTRDLTDGWTAGGDMGSEFGGAAKSFGGSQRPVVDRPQGTLDVPAENKGLGAELPARQQFSFNLHHINVTDVPILREVWLNIWYIDPKDVTAPMATFAATGNPADMAIPAGRAVKLEYKCPAATASARLISMYGHYHAHNVRFGASIVRGTERVPVYESFDWEHIPVYQFDSQSKNPQPNAAMRLDGAFSGLLNIATGDELHFECEVDNTSNATLAFTNETFTGEMCILFAGYTGANPCTRVTRAN